MSESAEHERTPSAQRFIRGGLADIRNFPVHAVLGLGIAPSLVLAVGDKLVTQVVPSSFQLLGIANRIVVATCWSLLAGGQILLGLAIIRKEGAAIGLLLQGLRFTLPLLPVIFGMGAFLFATHAGPASVVAHCGSVAGSLARTGGAIGAAYFLVRTITWIPLIVDQRISPWRALLRGLEQTRGREFRISWLLFCVGLPVGLLSVALRHCPTALLLAQSATSPILLLYYCRTYIFLDAVNSMSVNRQDA